MPRLIEYDTRSDDDIIWGLGLGCNGVVQILLESLHEQSDGAQALGFIRNRLQSRQRGVIATVIQEYQKNGRSGNSFIGRGKRLLFTPDVKREVSFFDKELVAAISQDAGAAWLENKTGIRTYKTATNEVEIFFDLIAPPRSLVIFGAEPDALPVMRLAKMTGWHVTVVDTKARHSSLERFSEADAIVLCRAENIGEHVLLSSDTSVVMMTHHFLADVALLMALLPAPVKYLGLLGSKPRTAKLLGALRAEANITDSQLARLHSPVGVDIGAETPEEIALSIVTEIQARATQHTAGFLRDRRAPIHEETQTKASLVRTNYSTQFPTVRKTAVQVVCPIS